MRFEDRENQQGMTLRDWFAGMALQGILANNLIDPSPDRNCTQDPLECDVAAEWAYEMADAMLKARSGSNGPALRP